MKKFYLFFTLCILASMLASAAQRYWVGPLDGNWNNPANWSATSAGPGGASVPGVQDSVIVNRNARINVDVSPTVKSLRITLSVRLTLYTGVPTTFTVTDSLNIPRYTGISGLGLTTLKDSTSADVPFNFIVNASTNAGAKILGEWEFEGGVPVSAGNGPTFTAAPGARVFVLAFAIGAGAGEPGGRIVYKQNTPDITSSPSTLSFGHNANFILDNNPTGAIPDASWEGERWTSRFSYNETSFIRISGSLTGELRHLSSRPSYGTIIASLGQLSADASLALPHGTLLKGNLLINNTNNQTLTLLASTGPSDSVTATIGVITNFAARAGGDVTISGTTTKVALARATGASAAPTYRLQVNDNFSQTSGNFSLQDADDVTGSSTLAIRGGLSHGGTFFTNSTATGPANLFVVEMDTPPFPEQGVLFTYTGINIGSGTIDNGRNMVTLRINHPVVYQPANNSLPYRITLSRSLEVGRLDLLSGRLITTPNSVLTVTDPDVTTAVKTGLGYVNGPIRRRTNSTNAYVFPTGRASDNPARIVVDSCIVIPASDEPSEYQAEYFFTRYADTQNVQPPLKGVSVDEYWNISKTLGADAKVGLIVNQRIPGATGRDVLVVARYANGQWISEQESELFPGDTTAGFVVSKNLSAFGPITFGYYPAPEVPSLFVVCPSDITINTDENKCTALIDFKAETGENTTIVYRIGSTEITSPFNFETGISTVTVTASNATGTKTCSFTVRVIDVQAPVISGISANPAILAPPDNEFRDVFIGYTVTDCEPVKTTLLVYSNQPQNGGVADWEYVDEHNVRLRAERVGGQDRTYFIIIRSTDGSGNKTEETVTVLVTEKNMDKDKIKLKVKVTPNPSRTYFTLNVTSNSDKRITMRVIDQSGRVKEVRRFFADSTIRLGDDYSPGIYYAIFSQGNVEKIITLIKIQD